MEWLFLVGLIVVVVVVAKWVLPPGRKYLALHEQVARERREKQPGADARSAGMGATGVTTRHSQSPVRRSAPQASVAPRAFPGDALDLRDLETFRTRIKGTAFVVPDDERFEAGGTTYALIREPANTYDPNAIAVHDGHRRVGYVSSARAGSMAPILDSMSAPAFLVSGAAPGEAGIRLWMDLPKIEALRRFAKSRAA